MTENTIATIHKLTLFVKNPQLSEIVNLMEAKRRQQKMKIKDLAKAVGCTPSYASEVLRGRHESVGYGLLTSMMSVLKIQFNITEQ